MNPSQRLQNAWKPSLRRVAPPVDVGPLTEFLYNKFSIKNMTMLNEDLVSTGETTSEGTYGFDRDGKGEGVIFVEHKISDSVPTVGQYRHLERLAKSGDDITAVVVHLSGSWYTSTATGRDAYWFDPIAVRIYRPNALEKWQRIEAPREQIFAAFGNWYITSKFRLS